ncbi:MAG: hypothetical protein OXB88_10955 [Bacteriovoracales bacterium]|nr:hypothetical protein [Bacteriovoracales bacterium]
MGPPSSSKLMRLLGTEDENFYRLGQEDKKAYSYARRSFLDNLSHFSSPLLQKLLGGGLEALALALLKRHRDMGQNLKAYAEGLERPCEKVFATFLLPELFSSYGLLTPNIMAPLLGCSSLFFRSTRSPGPPSKASSSPRGITHFRLLDISLSDSFSKYAQTILFSFPKQKVFFFTTLGIPYPSLTAMNESGITLALHQKPGKFFSLKGTPIMKLAKLIITEAKNREDIEKIVKENPSMSSWGLYLGLKEEVLEIDVIGDRHWITSHPLPEGKALYFCNEGPKETDTHKIIPYGFDEYNRMRREIVEDYLARESQKGPLSEDIILKGLTLPLGEKTVCTSRWKQSPLSPHTVDSCALNPVENRALRLRGKAPKILKRGYETYSDCFGSPRSQGHDEKGRKDLVHWEQGLEHLSEAMAHFRGKKTNALFHSLQMAEECYGGWPEQKIVHFYRIVFEYIFLKSARDENILLEDFEKLLGQLPPYLNEQCKLFILRLHKLLKLPPPDLTLEHEQLKRIWKGESKLQEKILRGKRFLYIPKPEILDIIYPFTS